MSYVSVVIPVFKPPLGLFDSCLNSVVSQSLSIAEVEALVVFDGSPSDEIVKIVETYNAVRPIRCIEIPRSGVSAARNAGIEAASGDWITFVDADDQLTPDALESMLSFAVANRCDLVLADHTKVYPDGSIEECSYSDATILPSDVFSQRVRHDILHPVTTTGSSCTKLYRLGDEPVLLLRFDDRLAVGEDTEFVFRYACAAERIGYLHHCVYLYQRNNCSTVNSFRDDYESRILSSLEIMHATIGDVALPDDFEEDYQSYVLFHLLLIMVHYLFNPAAPWTSSERRRHYKETLANPMFHESLNAWKWRDFSLTRNISLLSLKYGLYFMSKAIGGIRQHQLGN